MEQKKGWVAHFFENVQKMQTKILYDFPESERKKGYGNAAKVIVDGPAGGIFNLWFTETGVHEAPDDVPLRNTIYIGEDTLLDIITPNITLESLIALIEREGSLEKAVRHLRPRLDPRTAIANRLISMDGDTPDIDSEMWSQIFEKFLWDIAFPLVVRSMVRERRGHA